MNFELVRDSVISILGAAEAGQYRTIGYQERASSADEVLGNLRSVQVFLANDTFPKSASSMNLMMGDTEFTIVLSASSATELDLAVIENPASTPAEIAAAILAQQNAEDLASKSCEALFSLVWNTLNDPRNIDLGNPGLVSNRWTGEFRKGAPSRHGKLVAVLGEVSLTCRIEEIPTGEEVVNPLEGISGDLELKEDDVQESGVSNDYT